MFQVPKYCKNSNSNRPHLNNNEYRSLNNPNIINSSSNYDFNVNVRTHIGKWLKYQSSHESDVITF